MILPSLPTVRRFALIMLTLAPAILAEAQNTPAGRSLAEAHQFRANLVAGMRGKTQSVNQALANLRAQSAATGLSLSPQADFAIAAIDVGVTLVAAGNSDLAEVFFQEADKSLSIAIQSTPDRSAAEKSMLLQQRAMIRNNYLNMRDEAMADLDAALALQSDDPTLKLRRDRLSGEIALLKRAGQPKK